MPGIVLRTNAEKVVNRGGGYPTRMRRESIDLPGLFKKRKTITYREQSTIKLPGSDYIVFNCPAPDCGARNRKVAYEAKGQTGDGRLSFRCNKCYREVEVQRPMGQILSALPGGMAESKIQSGPAFRAGTILGPNGQPIGR